MEMFDPYKTLGLPRTADAETVKSAYRKQARLTHPDRGGDADAFMVVVRAFGVLSDPDARRLFDETGEVNDDNQRSAREEVALILADMFDAAVTAALGLGMPLDQVDFITQMTGALRSRATQAEDEVGKLDGEIEALKALRARIRRGDQGHNLFVDRLNGQVGAKVKAHAAARHRLTLFATAATELGNYDSEVELFSALDVG